MTPIYLEDLLSEKSFSEAANTLSRHFGDAHDFPPLYQVGAVVPDVESAAKALEARGIGPCKLPYLHQARKLDDLRVPPGNRLEALRGGRKGQHSVRINDRWRICFRWSKGDAYDVEIVDYQ